MPAVVKFGVAGAVAETNTPFRLQICNQAKSEVADALSARLRFARANQPDLIMMRKDARYRPPAPKPVCWTYFPFPSGLTTWRAHDEKPGQWTERVFIMMIPTSVR